MLTIDPRTSQSTHFVLAEEFLVTVDDRCQGKDTKVHFRILWSSKSPFGYACKATEISETDPFQDKRDLIRFTALSGVVSTSLPVAVAIAAAARAKLNCARAMTLQSIKRVAASTARASCLSVSPAFRAASAPAASCGTILVEGAAAMNSAGIVSRVGANVASSPIGAPAEIASSIIASFGFRTGMGARASLQASMHGPNAEQVNRIPFAQVPTA